MEDKGTRLVIRTTDVTDIDRVATEGYVRSYLHEEAPHVGSAVEGGVLDIELKFREGDYEYKQLREWQDLIMEPVLDSEGVKFISLSQRDNKINVGIEKMNFENRIFELTQAYNLPDDAVKISVTGPVFLDQTLRDMHRPLAGGLENNLYNSNGDKLRGACTYSFNAKWESSGKYWLTNSHCTREMGVVHSSDKYYQAAKSDGSSGYIGHEFQDPSGYNIPGFCFTLKCRFSDAAVLKMPSDQSWDFGEIVRTDEFPSAGGGATSINIDQNDPRIQIASEREDFFEGMWVSKIGRTTGWTMGEITNSCAIVNINQNNIDRLVCQEFATYHSFGGDSGAPVFTPIGPPQVSLTGIHWGRFTEGDQERIFSRIGGVQADFGGNLTTH